MCASLRTRCCLASVISAFYARPEHFSLSLSHPLPRETLSWLLLLLFTVIGSRCAHDEPMCLSTENVLVLEKKHESYLFSDRVTITASLARSQNHVLRNGAHCFRCLTARGREEYNAAGPTL